MFRRGSVVSLAATVCIAAGCANNRPAPSQQLPLDVLSAIAECSGGLKQAEAVKFQARLEQIGISVDGDLGRIDQGTRIPGLDSKDTLAAYTGYLQCIKDKKTGASKPIEGLLFDAELDSIKRKSESPESDRFEIRFLIRPLAAAHDQSFSIMFGFANIFDDALIPSGASDKTRSCEMVKGCIKYKAWDEWIKNPRWHRVGGKETALTIPWIVDIPVNVKYLRVFWRFYQSERGSMARCTIDPNTEPIDKQGIPPLHLVSQASGAPVPGGCLWSGDVAIIRIPERVSSAEKL